MDPAARQNVEKDMTILASFLSDFVATLPEVETLEEQIMSSDDRRTVYVVHTLSYTAVILLHKVWAEAGEGNQVESDICLDAAYQIARVPRAGIDVGLLDPILGVIFPTDPSAITITDVLSVDNWDDTGGVIHKRS